MAARGSDEPPALLYLLHTDDRPGDGVHHRTPECGVIPVCIGAPATHGDPVGHSSKHRYAVRIDVYDGRLCGRHPEHHACQISGVTVNTPASLPCSVANLVKNPWSVRRVIDPALRNGRGSDVAVGDDVNALVVLETRSQMGNHLAIQLVDQDPDQVW